MKNKQNTINKYFLLAALVILFGCSNAWAQSDRTFVATTGADTETCGASNSPCRNFSQGIFRTLAGGEVIALDSGIYDPIPVTIAKAITLTAAPGVHAELFNYYVNPTRITVNAGANDRVVLRNLYLTKLPSNGSGDGYGINVTSVGVLQIENCVVDGFSIGVFFELTSSAQVSIKDTIIRNNTLIGAGFNTTAGLIKASIDKCHFDNNVGSGVEFAGTGVYVGKRSKVTVRDSVATGNSAAGFYEAEDKADLNLENCESSNNRDGVIASDILGTGAGTTTVSNSIVTNNSRYGFLQQGTALFNSMGNNTVRRNVTSNTNGTITVISGT